MTDRTESADRYIFCNKCRGETEHTCKGEYYRDYPNYADADVVTHMERIGHRFWICSGCKTGTLEEYYVFDILSDEFKNDESTWDKKYYPPRNEFQIELKQFRQLARKLVVIYKETLGAYNNKLTTLCAIGIRSLLEGICEDKQVAGKNLEEKIDNMVTILPSNIVTNLHTIRFLGNEAAHELSVPSTEDLRLAIELCEDLLNYIYELDYKAQRLSTSRSLAKTRTKMAKSRKYSP